VRGAVVPFAVVIALEVLSRAGALDPVLFPAPSTVLTATGRSAGEISNHAVLTVGRAGVAFVVAVLAAVPAGILLGRSERLHGYLRPSVDGLRTLPAAAIVPLAILLLGIDDRMKVAVGAFGTCWPILLATIDGVHAVGPVMKDTIRTLHLAPTTTFAKVILPAALPHVLTGARISLSITLVLAVTVEMIAGDSGLGFYVLDAERSFRFAEMYGGVVVLAGIGAGANGLMRVVEKRLVYWR
jgi:NitT/TauT family transport system permease protein